MAINPVEGGGSKALMGRPLREELFLRLPIYIYILYIRMTLLKKLLKELKKTWKDS